MAISTILLSIAMFLVMSFIIHGFLSSRIDYGPLGISFIFVVGFLFMIAIDSTIK